MYKNKCINVYKNKTSLQDRLERKKNANIEVDLQRVVDISIGFNYKKAYITQGIRYNNLSVEREGKKGN